MESLDHWLESVTGKRLTHADGSPCWDFGDGDTGRKCIVKYDAATDAHALFYGPVKLAIIDTISQAETLVTALGIVL